MGVILLKFINRHGHEIALLSKWHVHEWLTVWVCIALVSAQLKKIFICVVEHLNIKKQLVSLFIFGEVWVGRICMRDDRLAGPCMLLFVFAFLLHVVLHGVLVCVCCSFLSGGNLISCWSIQHCFIMAHYRYYIAINATFSHQWSNILFFGINRVRFSWEPSMYTYLKIFDVW